MSQGWEVAHLGVINNSHRDPRDYREKTRTAEGRNHTAPQVKREEREKNNKIQLWSRQADRSRITTRAKTRGFASARRKEMQKTQREDRTKVNENWIVMNWEQVLLVRVCFPDCNKITAVYLSNLYCPFGTSTNSKTASLWRPVN